VRSWLLELLHPAFEQHGGNLDGVVTIIVDHGDAVRSSA